MNVAIPRYSGFCPGNRFAELSLKQLKKDWPGKSIDIIRDLIHNRQYEEQTMEQGFRIVSETGQTMPGDIAVIGTHGIGRAAFMSLRKKTDVLDLTCSKIKHLQNYVSYYSENGYYTLITGEEKHPEVSGLVSFAGDCEVIGDEDALARFMDGYRNGRGTIAVKAYCKILVVTQTTGSRELFEKTAQAVQKECGQSCEVKILDSLCSYNTLREEETLRLLKDVDFAVVIGDDISSNARRLHEAVKKTGVSCCMVKNCDELKNSGTDLKAYKKVLAVASSSTPDFVEKGVVDYIYSL